MDIYSLNSTIHYFVHIIDDNDVTATTTNFSDVSMRALAPQIAHVASQSMAKTESTLFGHPSTKYLNAHGYDTCDRGHRCNIDFIMNGVDAVNKRVAIKPLMIYLPDCRKVKSTHICDITKPVLPTV